jgi:hypothetical protein
MLYELVLFIQRHVVERHGGGHSPGWCGQSGCIGSRSVQGVFVSWCWGRLGVEPGGMAS